MQPRSLREADLAGKRVLLRAGFDVPIENGIVVDRTRIEATIPTIQHIRNAGGSVILLTHQGRPKGKIVPEMSTAPVAPVLQELLDRVIPFIPETVGERALDAAKNMKAGDVILLENLRFDPREEKNDRSFAEELSRLGDVYVNEAFPNAHRAHASVAAITEFLPSFMGLQFAEEVRYLSQIVENPKRPLTLVAGGAKMETKVPVIQHFLGKGDDVLLGGAIANTFLAAKGVPVGLSKFEQEQIPTAQHILNESTAPGHATVHVPSDAITASSPDETNPRQSAVSALSADSAMLDIGPDTVQAYCDVLSNSSMIVWNGPMGLFEKEQFAGATKRIALAIAQATEKGAISIIGGGDTIDFHTRYNMSLEPYTFVSTGGGAMLEFVSGLPLPAVEALKHSKS